MGSEEYVCPACGQPVERIVRRHKTLGAWVPVWVPGPCRNPDCPQYRPPEEPAETTAPPATEPDPSTTGTDSPGR